MKILAFVVCLMLGRIDLRRRQNHDDKVRLEMTSQGEAAIAQHQGILSREKKRAPPTYAGPISPAIFSACTVIAYVMTADLRMDRFCRDSGVLSCSSWCHVVFIMIRFTRTVAGVKIH